VLPTDEVKHGQVLFAGPEAEASSELLQEDGQALGGPEKECRVYLGDVDPLIEEVDREDEVDLAPPQPAPDLLPLGPRRLGAHRDRRDAGFVEHLGHKGGVFDADAEAEADDLIDRRGKALDGRQHRPNPLIVPGVEFRELALVVIPLPPRECVRIEIHRVGDAEVMERGEQPAVDCLGQAEFCRHMAVEVAKEVLAVGPFGRRGQAEQDRRRVVREEVAVRGCGGVVHFVDDNVVEVVR